MQFLKKNTKKYKVKIIKTYKNKMYLTFSFRNSRKKKKEIFNLNKADKY